MPNSSEKSAELTNSNKLDQSLKRIYKGASIRYTDIGDDIGVSTKSGGKFSITINKNKININNDQLLGKIIGKIESVKLISEIIDNGDKKEIETYEKYKKTSKSYSLFYRFVFQIITLNNSNIPPIYYNELKNSLENTVKNIQKVYKTLPLHIQFLLGIYGIKAKDSEVIQAINELSDSKIIAKLSDPRVDNNSKLSMINEDLLTNFIYFLKKDKKNWKPSKKNNATQDDSNKENPDKSGQEEQINDKTPDENNQEKKDDIKNDSPNEEYVENPDDFTDQGETEDTQEDDSKSDSGDNSGGDSGQNGDSGAGESPDYNEQYDTPEGGKFEKNNSNNGYKIEINPPMSGYFVIDNKSQFNKNTKKWLNISKTNNYDSSKIKLKGKKHTLTAEFNGSNLKSIPIPREYALDTNSLKYVGDKPRFFRDENGAFFLKIDSKTEISIDFYEEENMFISQPIKEDSEKLHNGGLTQKAEDAINKAQNEQDFKKKVKIIIEYIRANHFYPPGKNSKETMNNAKNLQKNLQDKSSNGSEYIENLDKSKHLECYSANTLFIAMLRFIGLNSRLATGHHLQGEINKNGNSEINSSNGHAWAVVWNGKDWVGFDATPNKDSSDPRNKKDPKDKDDDEKDEEKKGKTDKAKDGVEENEDNGESGEESGESGEESGESGEKSGESGEESGESGEESGESDEESGESDEESGESGEESGESGEELSEEEIEKELDEIYKDFEDSVSETPDEKEVDDYVEELKKMAIDVIEKDIDEKNLQNKFPGLSEQEIKSLAKFVKQFRHELDKMSRLKNPAFEKGESENETIEQELKSILDRVISRSIKEWEVPRFPVDDGYDLTLIDPVQLHIDTSEGRDVSYSYMERENREEEELKIVKVRRRKILDASGSMNEDGGKKLKIQQQIEVIDNKVTAEKQIELNELSDRLDRDLRLETETWQFGVRDHKTGLPYSRIKPLSSEFDEIEQAAVWQLAGRIEGSTNDFAPLEAIYKLLIDENNQSITNNSGPSVFERIRLGHLIRQVNSHSNLHKNEDELDDSDKIYFENLDSTNQQIVFTNLIRSIPLSKFTSQEQTFLNNLFSTGNFDINSYSTWIKKFIGNKILSDEEKDFFLNLDINGKNMTEIYSEWLDVLKEKYNGENIEPILEVIEVSSDGGSDNPNKLESIVFTLRSLGVIVVAYGIGSDGRIVEQRYANSQNPKEGGHYCDNLLKYPELKTKTWSTILDKV